MNMLGLKVRFPCTFLLIFCCFTFVSIYGKHEDLISSCEASVLVRRGTTWKSSPRQSLTVSCPVKHCGESPKVSWCKVDTIKCQQINNTKNVEITQSDKDVNELISFLTFKWISTHDEGLYRCNLKGHEYDLISHTINILVSDINQEVENSDNSADDESPSVDGDKAMSWLPYFSIFVSIALLVITLTVLTFYGFYGWKRILTYIHTNTQEMSTRTLPEFSKGSAPSTSVLHCSPTTAGTPPSLMTNQPAVAHTADKSQVSDNAVYAVINHRQSGMPTREHRTSTKQVKNPEYSAINVS